MAEREKVINGLEMLIETYGCRDVYYMDCKSCVYNGDPHCVDSILGDAISLLKSQEPRLLTVDDFKDNPDVDICGYLPCWVEPNPHNDAATEKPGWGLVSVGQIGGVYHRYWTGKPTQEQMEAAKW